jgi:hypothetical protein
MASEGSTVSASDAPSKAGVLRVLLIQIAVMIVTLAVIEIALRLFNPHYLRTEDWGGLSFQHDAELGWMPLPGTTTTVMLPRVLTIRNNSLGLRDIEFQPGRPAILVLGDSQVWGYNVEDGERFTNLMRADLPGHTIVNAGVAGYGTDQEYLILQRLWPTIAPKIVVLIFCVDNDRTDNSSNQRYFSYKPYFEAGPDGSLQVRGQPVPRARRVVLKESWWARNLFLARLAISAYVELRHRRVTVPDPTEKLIGMMRDFVQSRGARLVVGVQYREPRLEAYLAAENILFTTFEGGEQFDSSKHWTPAGNQLVADRLMALLKGRGLVNSPQRESSAQ